MAPFGSIGKLFGIDRGEAAAIAASFASDGLGAAIRTGISSIGGPVRGLGMPQPSVGPPNTQMVDVSAPPAGVDSVATLSQVSQTSMVPQSDMNQAFIGGFGLPGLVTGAARTAGRLLTKPGVGALVGGAGAGAVVDLFVDEFGQQKKLIITRKLQRDIKKIFMLTGGDARTTSDIYRSATGRFIPEDMIFKILFKTFKNQGPYVTKAAVRKTRATIRKMETLCDLKDRLCPPKPTRRRAPARRMSTSITQVK